MKKVICFLVGVLLFFMACSDDKNTRVIVTGPDVPPVVDPEPEHDTVKAVLWNYDSIKFYDGVTAWEWYGGYSAQSELMAWTKSTMDGNILYYMDEYGETITSRNLVIDPEFIATNGTDIYIAKNIEAAIPMLKTYTKIYLNGDEYGNWQDRQYECLGLYNVNGEIFAKKSNTEYFSINGSKTNIKKLTDEWVCHDYNSTTRRAYMNDTLVSWTTNFFNIANAWMKSGSIWYSHNGYTWNGSILNENGSAMTEFRYTYCITGYYAIPVLIKAGTRFENDETVLYYIECNSGWVIRYVPSIDQLQLKVRLYNGDGTRETGLIYDEILFPEIIDNHLYFRFNGQIYRYDFDSNLTSFFTDGVLKVVRF